MEAVPSHVLLACVLVGGAGTLMLHPVAFPSAGHQRLSSSAYNFITNWSFFAGNLLFLVRLPLRCCRASRCALDKRHGHVRAWHREES